MEKERKEAFDMLSKLLETQPDLIAKKSSQTRGKDAADFVIEFIEHYSEWLKRQQKPD